ncbi:MAG TPA: polysaccharide biosynthesis C-terminal domain-containing protein, partial [Halalkalibaculum sp.]|nr:polysaccharide biosynthesis C-terminal domain-containing protein [Halalkalibaculum sp.]
GLGYAINETLDRFLLNNYLSQDTITQLYGPDFSTESIVGIYNACYKLGVFMLLLVQMFRMAWQPFFLRHSDDPEAKSLFSDVFRYFNIAAGIVFLVIALFVEQIVQIKVPLLDAYLIGQDYWMGLHIVPVLLGAYWFQGWYMNFSAGIFIEEETSVLPKITLIGAGITVIFNLILIPFLGMMGSALATLISYACMALLLYRKSRAVYPVPYQMGRAYLMILIAAALVLLQPTFTSWFGSEWISGFILLLIGVGSIAPLGLLKQRNS